MKNLIFRFREIFFRDCRIFVLIWISFSSIKTWCFWEYVFVFLLMISKSRIFFFWLNFIHIDMKFVAIVMKKNEFACFFSKVFLYLLETRTHCMNFNKALILKYLFRSISLNNEFKIDAITSTISNSNNLQSKEKSFSKQSWR